MDTCNGPSPEYPYRGKKIKYNTEYYIKMVEQHLEETKNLLNCLKEQYEHEKENNKNV